MTTIDTRRRAGSTPLTLLHDIDEVLGLHPRQSLVLLVRRRRKPIAVLRLDLPQPPGPRTAEVWRAEHLRFAHVLTGLLARVHQAVAVTVVVYGDWGEPERRLVDVVSHSLDAAGFPVEAAVCVAGERWASVHGAAASDPPGWQALPSSHRQAASTAGSPGPHRGPFLAIEPIDPQRRLRALATLEASFSRVGGSPARPDSGVQDVAASDVAGTDVAGALLDWRAALCDRAGLPADPRAIGLAWSLRHVSVRDGVLIQSAWGFDAAILALCAAHDVQLSPVVEAAECGQPSPALPRGAGRGRQGAEGASGPGYSRVLGEGRVPPSAARLRRSVEVLRHVAACAPEPLRAPPLAILAWLEWCRGRGSVSAGYLEACLQVDPEYAFARLFEQMLASGHVPEWLGR